MVMCDFCHRFPIVVLMASTQVVSGCSTDLKDAPGFLTKCVLDIDIYKNRPSVHEHVKLPNPEVRASSWRALPLA